MEYQEEQVAVGWVINLLRKRVVWIILLVLVACAIFIRCLHLQNPYNYYILGPDSYFFHWVAKGILAGNTPASSPGAESLYTLHSGLAYPLAYIAKALGSIFNLTPVKSLELASELLPLLIGVIGLILLYIVVAKVYNRRVGMFAAFAWCVMLQPVFFTAAGYLDRDGLSVLLLMIGLFTFYLAREWHPHIFKRDIGWVLAGFVVLLTELILYLEWSFAGPLLLLAVLVIYSLVQILIGYFRHLQSEPRVMRRFTGAAKELDWRAFTLIIAVNIIVVVLLAAIVPNNIASWYSIIVRIVRHNALGASAVEELRGLSPVDLLVYHFFLIPILLSLYLAWRNRNKASLIFVCWFLVMLVLSLFAKRMLIYAAPAACVLSGLGLASIWDWRKAGQARLLKNLGVAALLFPLILVSFITDISIGSQGVPVEWEDALAYIRDTKNTPQHAIIMSQWGRGYWILDLGERRPLVDNGYYNYDAERLRDVALAYSTSDPSEAAQLMEKYGAQYLIFSQSDLNLSSTIMGWAGLDNEQEHQSFPKDSMVVQSLTKQFEAGGGLKVVYRSPNSEVVVLGLFKTNNQDVGN